MNDRDLQTQLDAYLTRFSTFSAPPQASTTAEESGRGQALRSHHKVLGRLVGVAGIVALAASIVLFAVELNAHRVSTAHTPIAHTVSPPSPVWSPRPLPSPNSRLALPGLPDRSLLPASARVLVPETHGMGHATVKIVPEEEELFIQYACVTSGDDSVVVSSPNLSDFPAEELTSCPQSASAADVVDSDLPAYPNEVLTAGDLGKPLTITIWAGASTTWEIFVAESGQPVPPVASQGLIAVSSNPFNVEGGENGDIYLLSGGAAPRRVIGSDGDGIAQACPAFSPDGQRLAYGEASASGLVTTARGDWPVSDRAVVIVKVSDPSHPLTRVALPTGPGEIACPEWSPDGRDVAFRVGTDLWVADSTSGKTKVLPVGAASLPHQGLAWSRDGSRIAVAERGDIRVIPVDGSAPAVISVAGGVQWSGAGSVGWTDDGAIVYTRFDSQDDAPGVYRVAADGTNDTRIASGSESAVSPDGTRVAYIDGGRVLTMDARGGDATDVPVPIEFPPVGLLWSPDGKRLLLTSTYGVVSVALTPGAAPIVYWDAQAGNPGEGLNLEWSISQVTWQPVKGPTG